MHSCFVPNLITYSSPWQLNKIVYDKQLQKDCSLYHQLTTRRCSHDWMIPIGLLMARPGLLRWWRCGGIIILRINQRDWYVTSRGFSGHCIGHCRKCGTRKSMVRALPEPGPVTVIFRLAICVWTSKTRCLLRILLVMYPLLIRMPILQSQRISIIPYLLDLLVVSWSCLYTPSLHACSFTVLNQFIAGPNAAAD